LPLGLVDCHREGQLDWELVPVDREGEIEVVIDSDSWDANSLALVVSSEDACSDSVIAKLQYLHPRTIAEAHSHIQVSDQHNYCVDLQPSLVGWQAGRFDALRVSGMMDSWCSESVVSIEWYTRSSPGRFRELRR
jgi:hypothetical protein